MTERARKDRPGFRRRPRKNDRRVRGHSGRVRNGGDRVTRAADDRQPSHRSECEDRWLVLRPNEQLPSRTNPKLLPRPLNSSARPCSIADLPRRRSSRTSRTVVVNERASRPTAPRMRPRTTTVLRRGRRRLEEIQRDAPSGSIGAVPCRVPLRIFLLRSAEAPRTGTPSYLRGSGSRR